MPPSMPLSARSARSDHSLFLSPRSKKKKDEGKEAGQKERRMSFAIADNKLLALKRSLFHIGLSLSLLGYMALGAALFLWLEAPFEKRVRRETEALHEKRMDALLEQIHGIFGASEEDGAHPDASSLNKTAALSFEEFEEQFNSLFDTYQLHLFELFHDPLKSSLFEKSRLKASLLSFQSVEKQDNGKETDFNDADDDDIWSFQSALLFTSMTIIPVGFGHVTPVTPLGRLAVIVYSVIGLPLALFTLSDLGRFFYKMLFKLVGRSVNRVNLVLFVLLLGYPLAVAASITYLLAPPSERISLTDSIYFCISSIFTIGFGDLLPTIPLGYLLAFIVFGVTLVTVCVDALGTEVIHHIHFAGRQIGRARKLASKFVEAAQRVNIAKRGLGMGLAMQMDVFARLGQGSVNGQNKKTGKKMSSSLDPLGLKPQTLHFEPSIAVDIDFVDANSI